MTFHSVYDEEETKLKNESKKMDGLRLRWKKQRGELGMLKGVSYVLKRYEAGNWC